MSLVLRSAIGAQAGPGIRVDQDGTYLTLIRFREPDTIDFQKALPHIQHSRFNRLQGICICYREVICDNLISVNIKRESGKVSLRSFVKSIFSESDS